MERVDRCVVLVDAGYLLGAAASLLAGEPARSRITVDHAALIQGLRERAEADTQQPLLRIYWFDGAPDRVPQPEHRRLRVMPRVTVRLGALTRSDGRWAQKGVDAAMHAELTELARNRACSDIVLVTGDGDLLPGLMSAKEHGVAVHLWAVQAADGDYNQSEDLVAEADERRVLDRAWITKAVRAKDTGGVCAPPPATRPEIAAILSAPLPEAALAASAERASEATRAAAARGGPPAPDETAPAVEPAAPDTPAAGHKGVPTPKDLAALRAHAPQPDRPQPHQPAGATLRWSSDKGWVERGGGLGEPPETASLPTLAQVTSAEQRWADREEDITTVGGDPFEVGQVFARRWMERLPETVHLQKLSTMYPRIPHRIDGELLRYAARFGLLAHKDDQIDEHDRYAIRAGFWREIDVRAAAEHVPAAE
ncbi:MULTISPECIES: NYN domain-containing protein [Streptomyces]|uniref:NYN domain-containing protein n=1 Tax=Streptomyces TaxID=1883 RepID=UPI0004C0338F|nr:MULTISPECIES: NYN domain-containing protein [Streptomyces]MBD3545289.1 NYN domain-containing protein [Streptomyces sp. JV180]MBD3553601.1 NYN domain-containing protein [Streptomyces sp. SP18CM02]MCF3170274.1 NYN domain-containing protein [Streptomyces violaceoruber]MDW4898044.1 NYN domain-containing protein [Streptomyces californicus]MDW4914429.1 NYN domain-containing protein [Streptomyces californicus]